MQENSPERSQRLFMIIASALGTGCVQLWSEDMQDGMRIDKRPHIRNPFA